MWSFGNSLRCQFASRMTTHPADLVSLAIIIAMAGCGGGKPPVQTADQGEAAPTKATSKSKEDGQTSTDVAASKPTTSGTGRKGNSGIPYDAFFDDPLGEVANTAAAPGAAVAKTDAPTAEPAKPAADVPKAAAGGGNSSWGEIMPLDNLQEEIKKLRNHLTASLQNQKSYNDSFKDIAVDGAVLAALAGVVLEHSDAVSWKANAHYVRDFGFEIFSSANGPGKDGFEKSKAAFEKITAVFSGSIPADAGDVAAKRPLAEVADRGGVMKRIEKAKEWMRLNINTEAKLKSETDQILHEAMIVATLGKVVSTEGYSNADEEDYQKYAENLVNGAKETMSAVKDQSFQKFTDSINKINKSCEQCHANYGTG